MNISNTILKRALENVYFIWGRGKTTIANRLHEKYGFCIYHTDDGRDLHAKHATPDEQPYMCRDFMKEFGVKSFWELPGEVIAEREEHFLQEVTPMLIVDLLALSGRHEVILCEGDIDYRTVLPIATHAVYLRNCSTKFDWFDRPDHTGMLDEISNRTDLSEDEKEAVIRNAYESVSGNESIVPEWVTEFGIKNIDWDDSTGIDRTLAEVEKYFGFNIKIKYLADSTQITKTI